MIFFISCANKSVAYRFLVFKFDVSNIHVNIIIEYVDAEFFDEIFPYKESRPSLSKKRTHDESHDEPSMSGVQEQNLEPRIGNRTKFQKI